MGFSMENGAGGGAGFTHVMHGRSRMTIDHRIPTMPGRSKSGFSLARQTSLSCTMLAAP